MHLHALSSCHSARLLLLLLISAPAHIHAQQAETLDTVVLRGAVVDIESGAPIAGARVQIDPLGRSVLTDDKGAFVVQDLPVGTYTLRAARIGYAPAEQLDVPIRRDALLTLVLRQQAVVIEGISVEANGRVPALVAQLEERRRTVGYSASAYYQEALLSAAVDDAEDFILHRTPMELGTCRAGGFGCPHLRGREITPLVLVDENVVSFSDLADIPPHHIAAVEVFQDGAMIRIYTNAFLGAYALAGRPLPLQDIIRVQGPRGVDRGWSWDEFDKMRTNAKKRRGH